VSQATLDELRLCVFPWHPTHAWLWEGLVGDKV